MKEDRKSGLRKYSRFQIKFPNKESEEAFLNLIRKSGSVRLGDRTKIGPDKLVK